jgi:hypothetical protein
MTTEELKCCCRDLLSEHPQGGRCTHKGCHCKKAVKALPLFADGRKEGDDWRWLLPYDEDKCKYEPEAVKKWERSCHSKLPLETAMALIAEELKDNSDKRGMSRVLAAYGLSLRAGGCPHGKRAKRRCSECRRERERSPQYSERTRLRMRRYRDRLRAAPDAFSIDDLPGPRVKAEPPTEPGRKT